MLVLLLLLCLSQSTFANIRLMLRNKYVGQPVAYQIDWVYRGRVKPIEKDSVIVLYHGPKSEDKMNEGRAYVGLKFPTEPIKLSSLLSIPAVADLEDGKELILDLLERNGKLVIDWVGDMPPAPSAPTASCPENAPKLEQKKQEEGKKSDAAASDEKPLTAGQTPGE